MSCYVIPHGDDPEEHMEAAIAAGADSIQVGLPEGVTEAASGTAHPHPRSPSRRL